MQNGVTPAKIFLSTPLNMKVKKGSCSIKPIYAIEKTLFITRVIRAVQTIIDKILVILSLMKNVKLIDNEITNIEKTIAYTLIQY